MMSYRVVETSKNGRQLCYQPLEGLSTERA